MYAKLAFVIAILIPHVALAADLSKLIGV